MRLPSIKSLVLHLAVLAGGTCANAGENTMYLSHPDAVDGQTLSDSSGNTYRLFAVKTPAPGRHCLDGNGADFDCGEKARTVLQIYASSMLTCTPIATNGDQKVIRCKDFLGRDVGARMVKTGWAVPDRAVSDQYIFEEMEAEARRSGLWQGRFHSAL